MDAWLKSSYPLTNFYYRADDHTPQRKVDLQRLRHCTSSLASSVVALLDGALCLIAGSCFESNIRRRANSTYPYGYGEAPSWSNAGQTSVSSRMVLMSRGDRASPLRFTGQVNFGEGFATHAELGMSLSKRISKCAIELRMKLWMPTSPVRYPISPFRWHSVL